MTEAPVTGIREAFLHSEEGRIFILGCLMLIVWVMTAAALCYSQHPWWAEIFSVAVGHMLAGKGVSIAQGTAIGMPGGLIAAISVVEEASEMLDLYLFMTLM